jgi:membrane protein YqaA with SNARE-associated domain
MIFGQIAFSIPRWAGRWGAAGLIAVGIIDSSFIPIPGGMDLMTAIFAAGHRELWFYYALMATGGSVAGGYLTYRISQKGGKVALEQRVPKDKIRRVDSMFERWGFGTVLLAAIMPPPIPAVPFIAGAGALNYPVKKFIVALTLARMTRFTLLAYLASLYSRTALHWIGKLHLGGSFVLIFIGVLAGLGIAAWFFLRRRRAA